MNRKPLTRVASALALMFGLALVATNANARGRGHHRGGPLLKAPIEKLVEKLGLSEEQATRLEAIRAEAKAERKAAREEMKAAHKKMKALWEAEEIDAEAIRAQFERLHALKGDRGRVMLEVKLQIANLLTPEQRAEMQTMREARRGHRKGHHKRHRGGDFDGPCGGDRGGDCGGEAPQLD